MKKFFFFIAIFLLAQSSCQKDIAYTAKEKASTLATKSDRNSINSNKQDRKILFVSNRDGNDEIYAMNIDGSNVVRLTYNNVPDGRATWSANGQHIAFASGLPGLKDIYVMNANGSGLKNITNTPSDDEDFPEWSPNGNDVIFSSNRDGNYEIYTTNLGGNQLTRLTHRLQDDKWPTWSPDGSKIAFHSDLGGTELTEVFVMKADGSERFDA